MRSIAARVSVRPRTDADLPGLVAALAEVHRVDAYPASPRLVSAAWLCEDPRPGDRSWVALVDGLVVGQVTLADLGDGWEVRRLFVAPAGRGRGAAAALMGAAESHARTSGRPARLEVVHLGRDAIALYERRGWRRTGDYVADWTAADGHPARMFTYELV